jgi:homocysteine S-methyltransferase
LGHDASELDRFNRLAVSAAAATRDAADLGAPVLISGLIGPRGDGYVPGELMSPAEAAAYHGAQIATFVDTDADLVTAITMTNVDEAIGIGVAAAA